MAVSFTVNGKAAASDAPPTTPLLWIIREQLKLTGTRFGCGAGLWAIALKQAEPRQSVRTLAMSFLMANNLTPFH
jgi:aerobic-type carbon monoxide dehydrogenase small subunit (CoxS/CutS family)